MPVSGPERAIGRLTDLIGRRLMLMPAVGWAKLAAGRAVEDSVRETDVERAAAKAARDAHLNEAAYLKLVRAQFAAARAVQRAATSSIPSRPGRSSDEGLRELTQVLRPAIERLDREILEQLKTLGPLEGSSEGLVAALRADAPVAGLDDDTLRPLADAIRQVVAMRARNAPETETGLAGRKEGTSRK
jgi:chorismate mutase